MRIPPLFACCFLACATLSAQAAPAAFTLEIHNAAGATLASKSDPKEAVLDYKAAYQPGDQIIISTPADQPFLVVKVDDKVPEATVYSPKGEVNFAVPFGKLAGIYDPQAFTGTSHHITVRAAMLAELNTYRNLAVDSIDQRWQKQYFPHALASIVTRDEPQFFERNAIDGNTQNKKHGPWPYESWGNGKAENPWLDVYFGREVAVDKVRLYIRCDFPHDSYWTNMTLQFSDGSSQDITVQKTSDPQDYSFPEKKITWMRLTNFKQPVQPLGWAALTEVEVYGKDETGPDSVLGKILRADK